MTHTTKADDTSANLLKPKAFVSFETKLKKTALTEHLTDKQIAELNEVIQFCLTELKKDIDNLDLTADTDMEREYLKVKILNIIEEAFGEIK